MIIEGAEVEHYKLFHRLLYNQILEDALLSKTKAEKIKDFKIESIELFKTFVHFRKKFIEDENDAFFYFMIALTALKYYSHKLASVRMDNIIERIMFFALNGSETIFFYDYMQNHYDYLLKKEEIEAYEPFMHIYNLGKNWKEFFEAFVFKEFEGDMFEIGGSVSDGYRAYSRGLEDIEKASESLNEKLNKAVEYVVENNFTGLDEIFFRHTKKLSIDFPENYLYCTDGCYLLYLNSIGDNIFEKSIMKIVNKSVVDNIDLAFYTKKQLFMLSFFLIYAITGDNPNNIQLIRLKEEMFKHIILNIDPNEYDDYKEPIFRNRIQELIDRFRGHLNKLYIASKQENWKKMLLANLDGKDIKDIIDYLESELVYMLANDRNLSGYDTIDDNTSPDEAAKIAESEYKFAKGVIVKSLENYVLSFFYNKSKEGSS